MTIKLYVNYSDNNVVNKSITEMYSFDCILKHESDVYHPIVRVTVASNVNMGQINYCYIEYYGRYYYITNMTVYPNNIYELELKCDVLMTYKAGLANLEVVVGKNANCYDLYLNDGELYTECRKKWQTKAFPNTPFSVSTENYVVQVR